MTLLEKAKAVPLPTGTGRNQKDVRRPPEEEEFNLVMAWLTGEVNTHQCAEALGVTHPGFKFRAASIVRWGLKEGIININ